MEYNIWPLIFPSNRPVHARLCPSQPNSTWWIIGGNLNSVFLPLLREMAPQTLRIWDILTAYSDPCRVFIPHRVGWWPPSGLWPKRLCIFPHRVIGPINCPSLFHLAAQKMSHPARGWVIYPVFQPNDTVVKSILRFTWLRYYTLSRLFRLDNRAWLRWRFFNIPL